MMESQFIAFWKEMIELGNRPNTALLSPYLDLLHRYSGSLASAFLRKADSLTVKKIYSVPSDFLADKEDEFLNLFQTDNLLETLDGTQFGFSEEIKLIVLPVSSSNFIGIFVIQKTKESISNEFYYFLENAQIALTQQLKMNSLTDAAARRHHQFNIILETVPESVIYFEEDGNFVWLNSAARKMLQIKVQSAKPEDISRKMQEFRDRAFNRDAILKTGLQFFQNPNQQINDWHWIFGDPVSCVYRVSVLNTVYENSKGQLWLFDDVTSQYLSNIELKRLNAEIKEKIIIAETANQSKSVFLANMSHELRTPLNSILGFSQILRQSSGLANIEKEHVNFIYKSGEHLLSLINDILDLSKIEAGKMDLFFDIFSLKSMIYTISKMIEVKAIEKGLGFELRLSPDIPPAVIFDEQKLKQVLLNLLSNAVKYTDKGEVILSVYSEETEDSRMKFRFSVRDTGRGIPESEKERIFQPFEQLNSGSSFIQGTGLGLSVTKSLVEMMGGHIAVESESGKGSTFSFEIEADVSDSEKDESYLQDDIFGYKGERKKILIVDDVILNRILLERTLVKLDFIVEYAESGKQAMEKAEKFIPDLIFMDLRMPGISGYDAITMIKKDPAWSKVKIVATSASAFNETRNRCISAGADDFLPKPIEFSELISKLTTSLKLDWIQKETLSADANETSEVSSDMKKIRESVLMLELLNGAENGEVAKIQAVLRRLKETFPGKTSLWTKYEKFLDHFEINLLLDNVRNLMGGTV